MVYVGTTLKVLGFLAIFSLVFAFSLKLPLNDFLQTMKRVPLLLRSFLSNFVIIPFFTLGLCSALQLSLPVSTAMLLLSFAPYAPAIPKLAGKSGADLPLALSLTVLSAFFSLLMTPWLCERLLPVLSGSAPIEVRSLEILQSLAKSIFLPFLLGVFIHELRPDVADRLSKWTERFSNIVLPLLLLVIFVAKFENFRQLVGLDLLAMFIASVAFSIVGYNFSDSEEGARRATALGSELRHPSVAIYLGTEYFADLQVAPSIVAFFLISFVVAALRKKLWMIGDTRKEEESAPPGRGVRI